MNGGKNQRTLLMELLVVVLFFSLCATVLLQTFMAARETSRRAGLQSAVLTELQVLSERLYAAENPQTLLESEGFDYVEGKWTLGFDRQDTEGAWNPTDGMIYDGAWVRVGDYLIVALQSDEAAPAGSLRTISLTASEKGEVLAQWDCTRYIPGEVGE